MTPFYLNSETIYNKTYPIFDGTTIITSVTNDRIIIAADSKQAWGGDSKHDNSNIPLRCRIRHIGDIFFAAEGHTQINSPKIDFLSILENLNFEENQRFHDKVIYVESKLREPINTYVVNFERYNPKSFAAILDKSFLSIVFAGFEDGKPVCEALYWTVKSNQNHWRVVTTPMYSDNIPRFMIQGHREAIDSVLKSKKHDMYNEKELIELIEIQGKSTPLVVGLPIDVVEITVNGFRWIQKKPKCE